MAEGKIKFEDQGPNPNAWMVTFADLVMLLLTFFVLLLTMSSMDAKKVKGLISHFKGSTGVLEFSGSRGITDLASFITSYRDSDNILVIDQNLIRSLLIPSTRSEEKVEEVLQDINKLINITDDERGIVITFQEDVMFDAGEVRIKEEVIPLLNSISEAIASLPYGILIMGHTDNIPFRSRLYDSNWELSAYRALAVLQYFIKEKGLPPERFSVGGYGPLR
ncbi:MAG: hypothetical protein DRH11_18530, partial [Deltaproteobacteria bacterium]